MADIPVSTQTTHSTVRVIQSDANTCTHMHITKQHNYVYMHVYTATEASADMKEASLNNLVYSQRDLSQEHNMSSVSKLILNSDCRIESKYQLIL